MVAAKTCTSYVWFLAMLREPVIGGRPTSLSKKEKKKEVTNYSSALNTVLWLWSSSWGRFRGFLTCFLVLSRLYIQGNYSEIRLSYYSPHMKDSPSTSIFYWVLCHVGSGINDRSTDFGPYFPPLPLLYNFSKHVMASHGISYRLFTTDVWMKALFHSREIT